MHLVSQDIFEISIHLIHVLQDWIVKWICELYIEPIVIYLAEQIINGGYRPFISFNNVGWLSVHYGVDSCQLTLLVHEIFVVAKLGCFRCIDFAILIGSNGRCVHWTLLCFTIKLHILSARFLLYLWMIWDLLLLSLVANSTSLFVTEIIITICAF